MGNELKVRHVEKTYKDVRALNDVSFSMKNGIFGLIGPNGAGKSTLINIMSTLIRPGAGRVLYNEQDIFKSGKDYRRYIGLMPQQQKGYEQFSGNDFLYYMASLKGLTQKEAADQITDLVKQVALEAAIYRKIKTYSGGMRQRLMFAQAILGQPRIIILDEPTSGLDPFERIRLRNYISQIAEERIVLIATHVMQDIESIANEVLFLNKGQLVFKGTSEELMNPLHGHVFETTINSVDLDEIQKRFRISRLSKYEHQYIVRYIDENRSDGHLFANMEDAYLYYMVDHETTLL